MAAYSGSKVKRFVIDLTEIKRPANKNKGIDGNVSNKFKTLPRCSKDLDLTKEVNKDCHGAVHKTLFIKKKKSAPWKMAKTHSDSMQKDLHIEKKLDKFDNTKSKTVETSFLNNKNNISLAKEETKVKEEHIKPTLNEDINQQEETVLNLGDTITTIRNTKENNEMVYQKLHKSYKDDMPIETEVTEQKEIRIDPVGCFDDIFGENNFDEDQNDNYIVEAKNRVGHELTILSIEVIRYSKKENETEEDIKSLIQKSDFVFRKEETCSLDQTKSELKSQHSSSDESLHRYENCVQKVENGLECQDTCSEESLHTYLNVPYKEIEERVQTPTEFNSSLQYSCSLSSKNNCAEKRKQDDNFYRYSIRLSESLDTSIEDQLDGMLLTTDKPVEKEEKINYVIEQIVKTEELYIRGLKRVIKDYMPFVIKETPVNLIRKTMYIFGNIEAVYEKAKKFLKLLKQTEQDPNSIAQLFIDNAKMFELYLLYLKNKPKADMYLKEFDEIIKVRQAQLKDNLGLASYLLTPIRRLERYVLLLEQIKRELKKQEKPLEVIENAIGVIRNVMRQGNDSIAIDSIKQSPFNLTLYGSFIMRAVFNIRKPRKFVSMVFLFENIVVFTEKAYKNSEHFKYVDSIEMRDLSLANFDDKPLVFHLTNFTKSERIGPEATYVLEAKTPKMKYEWTEVISSKLWMQFKNAKEQLQKQNSYPTDRHQTKPPQSNITNKGRDRSQRSIKRKSKFYHDA